MSGSRAKALRADFRDRLHRAPRKAGWSEAKKMVHHYRSRVRTRLGWLLGKSRKLVVRMADHTAPSEWRAYKRAWKRAGLNALETFGR